MSSVSFRVFRFYIYVYNSTQTHPLITRLKGDFRNVVHGDSVQYIFAEWNMVAMLNKYLLNETEMGPGFSRPLKTFLRLPEVHTKVNSVCIVRLWAHSLQVGTLQVWQTGEHCGSAAPCDYMCGLHLTPFPWTWRPLISALLSFPPCRRLWKGVNMMGFSV